MLKRKIEEEINNWISNGKKALLVDGARQVGKTYSIRKCLQNSKKDYLEINLIESAEWISALDKAVSVEDLTINLSAATGHSLIKGETILFLDEVQELKDLVTKIKFWVDEGSYRFVLSGSLLGVELQDLRSAPVGYVHEIKMFPMDFEEFLVASGVRNEVLDYLKECFFQKKQVGEAIHSVIMKHFQRYLVVGGMPEAVNKFVETGDITEVGALQKDLLRFYSRDFTKYEAKYKKLMLTDIYEQIPAQLLKQNRRFNYADIKKGLRFERMENSFVWLYKSGVVLPAFNATEPKISLKLNSKNSLVKLYYSDIGMLTYACGTALRKDILFDTHQTNLGGVYENAIIQELTAHRFEVYYYNSKKLGELDFVIEHEGRIVPIEVKSGKDYYVHTAINNVLDVKDFKIPEAIVFSNYDTISKEGIIYYPVYMCAFLTNDDTISTLAPIL